jgi:hypothetical protein
MREYRAKNIKGYVFKRFPGMTKTLFVSMADPKILGQRRNSKGEIENIVMAKTNMYKNTYRKLKKLWNVQPRNLRNEKAMQGMFSTIKV